VALAAIPDCVCKVNVGSAVPGVSERNMALTGKKQKGNNGFEDGRRALGTKANG